MDYFILAETNFFQYIIRQSECADLTVAYHEFIAQVIELCVNPDSCTAFVALSYAETELQYHEIPYAENDGNGRNLYVRKALSFVRKMQKHLVTIHRPVPPLSSIDNEKRNETPTMQWSGSTAELVELIYGLDELKLINQGETGIKELLAMFCKVLGMDIKENQCYNTYADIKRRKNESRTYFFDRAAERLNERMVRDESGKR